MEQLDKYLVAAVQAAPVFLDRDATVAKCCALIGEAAEHGARLVVFPEAFIPTYPLWIWHLSAGDTAALRTNYQKLLEQGVSVPGPATERLGQAAREHRVHLAVGVNEINVEGSGTSLYNTILWFGPDGALLGRHRKLVPTTGERLIHASGDGSTLDVFSTSLGKLGGLICWENYMPLARYALYAAGIEVWVAPTWDRGEPWLSTLRHVAKEGRTYVIGCCSAVRREDVPGSPEYLAKAPTWLNPGDSVIVDPDGKVLAGPVREREEILYAEVDRARLRGARFQLDVAGHYARPDIFHLTVDRTPRPFVAAPDHPTGT